MPTTAPKTDLEAFEALVLSQQPASVPWTPVTDYSFDARKQIEGIQPQLILDHLVSCEDADILDYGCGPDAHLVRLLAEASEGTQIGIFGYDPQRAGSDQYLSRGRSYDLVICREVLEHLTILDIRKTVTRLCALSAQFVYGTTRFSSEHDLLRVDTSDNLDPTHITLPSKDFLKILFVLEGFRWRGDLAEKMDHMQKGRTFVFQRSI